MFKKKDTAVGAPASADGLIVTQVWGQRGWQNRDVVGESHHSSAIRALLPTKHDDGGEEVIVPVTIVHNPANQYDKNAIEVRASTGLIGYLPKAEASEFAPVLSALQINGRVAGTTARVYGYMGYDYDTDKKGFIGSARVDLAEPHLLFPANLPPDEPHTVLPEDGAIQVTGEEQHMAALRPFLNSKGECWVHATVHSVVEKSARAEKTLAEIRIDGLPVGRLTPKMSADLLPAVDYLAERGHVACVHAMVKGNHLKTDVVLHTLRAGELPPEWFAARPLPAPGQITTSIESPADMVVASQTATAPTATAPTATADIESAVAPTQSTNGSTAAPETPQTSGLLPPAAAQLPPADWYPDPDGLKRLRYWDGQQWTQHVAD